MLFLDKSNQTKITLLKYFKTRSNDALNLKEICRDLQLSTFLLTKNIASLREDMKTYDLKGIKIITSDNQLQVTITNSDEIFQLSYHYLHQSELFQLAQLFLTQPNNILNFYSDALYFSVSKIFSLKKIIQASLEPYNITISNENSLEGNEIEVRRHLFTFYLKRFHSLKYPFSTFLLEKLDCFIAQLEEKLGLRFSNVNRIKLVYLLSIQNIRIETGFALDHFKPFIIVGNSHPALLLLQNFLVASGCPAHLVFRESYYIYSFLVVENFIEIQQDQIHFPEVFKQKSNELLELVEYLMQSDLDKKTREKLYTETLFINYKYLTYSSKIVDDYRETFLANYEKNFPRLFHTVKNYLFEHSSKRAWELRDQLLMEYIFIFTKYLPIQLLEEPIRIVVDFSLGERFNDYIRRILKSFNNLNVEIVSDDQPDFDIYLSDFSSLIPHDNQLLWSEPPAMQDWNELLALIATVRRKKYLQQQPTKLPSF